jgi:capsid protein
MLIKHFTSSYSASRAAMLEAWKFFRARREWLAWNLCQPVYEAVITEAVASGRLDAPGFFEDPLVRMAYCNANWTGPPAGQIDPQAEIDAAKTRVDLGVSTLQEVTAEMTGGDWETKHAQRVKEQAMRVKGGLDKEANAALAAAEARQVPGEGPMPPREPMPARDRQNGNGAYR